MTRPPHRFLLAAGLAVSFAAPAAAQEPRSAPLARELTQLMAERKLDSFAARLPDASDEFAAALAFPGQLVVVWARFAAPAVLNEKILKREYREAYIDLNAASDVATRHFVTDIGADGIRRGGRDQPSDMHDIGTKSMRFDGSWREDKMSEEEYMKALADADASYARVLGVLVEQLKKVG